MTGPRPKIKQIKKPAQDTTKLKQQIKDRTFTHGLLDEAGRREQFKPKTEARTARRDSIMDAAFSNRRALRKDKAALKKARAGGGKSTDRRGAKKEKES